MSYVPKSGRLVGAAAILAAVTSASVLAAISPASAAPPANDNIANAQVISGPIGSVNGTLTEATTEPGENAVNGVSPNRTVWYRWLPAHDGPVTFRTNNTNPNDPTMFLAVGTTIGQRTNANDDGVPNEPWFRDSKITFTATAGQTYSIGVGSFSGSQFTFTLNWNQTVPAGAVITGTGKKDVLNGTGGDDIIFGKGNNDTINGNGGNDTIIGGGGNDTINGGPGADVMLGKGGKDKFIAQDGFIDTINGGGGTNRFLSRDANDIATKVKG